MRPAFLGQPAEEILLSATLAIWAILEVRQALNRRAEATTSDRGSLFGVRLFSAIGIVVSTLAAKVTATAIPRSPLVIGVALVIMWAGIGLRVWSFRTLGRYFTFQVMTSNDQPVIMTGPYRFVRHPSYTGILVILAGLGLTLGNWLSLVALVVFPLIGFINRIRVEEAALSATLGSSYTSYASHRKRLVPYVW